MVEGFNTSDLNWGTANAQTVTLSFWVRSSLTGTFGGAINNYGSYNRSYPFSYTINSANTWEYKTVVIPGDQSGTWTGATNNGSFIIGFGLGVGSTYSGAAGAWTGGNLKSATGATSVVGTNGATFYITGVQLEKGSVATPFEFRPYGTELALCQRYYENSFGIGTAPADGSAQSFCGGAMAVTAYAGNTMRTIMFNYAVPKRATPTVTLYRPGTIAKANTLAYYSGAWGPMTTSSIETFGAPTLSFQVRSGAASSVGVAYMIDGGWAANAEL